MMETADVAPDTAPRPSTPPPQQQHEADAGQPQPSGSGAAATEASEAAADEEEETRVITLDTIIRKGLVEQMPMTAKDVVNIVSKSMQKERERQAADRLRLAASAQPSSGVASSAGPTTSTAGAAASQHQQQRDENSSSDNSESSDDYDSHNEDDHDDDVDDGDVVDGAVAAAVTTDSEPGPSIKQPPSISVIQRAPPPPPPPNQTAENAQQQQPICNEMQLADDLRASNAFAVAVAVPSIAGSSDDQLEEECDLRSGDLHYSESNTSDNSDAEHRMSRSSTERQPVDESPRMSSRRRRTPLVTSAVPTTPTRHKTAGRTTAAGTRSAADIAQLQRERSCTDSKRNAILMQCSAAASAVLAKPRRSRTPPPPEEEDEEAPANDPEVADMNLESMLQVQHSMDDVDMVDTSQLDAMDAERGVQTPSGSPIVIKVERVTPVEELLVVHHVQTSSIADAASDPAASAAAAVPAKKRRARGAGKATRPAAVKAPKVATTVKKPARKKKTTEAADAAVLTTLPTIQAVYSVADAPDTAAGTAAVAAATAAAAAEAVAAAKHREKRQSATKSTPVYAELSDNSQDPTDGTRKPRTKVAKSSSGSDATTPQRIHWKTQLKLQRQQTESAAAAAAAASVGTPAVEEPTAMSPERVPEEATTAPVATEDAITPEDDPQDERDDDDGSGSAPESLASTVHSNVINKIIEPPHNQKRIPKLKYGSFNFTERRGMLAKGPKMVLKYKKKYKRKTKSVHAAASGIGANEGGVTTSAVGADVKQELPKASVEVNGQRDKGVEALAKKTHVKKRKSTKPPSSATSSSTTTSASEPPQKLSKSTKLLMPTDGSAPAADTTRSLRERNKVLLEILEHRIYEIRHLKLRLAHMQHSTHALHSPPITDSNSSNNNGCAPVFPLSSGATMPPLRPKLEPGLEQSFDPLISGTTSTTTTTTTTDATPDWSADELAQAHSLHSLNPLLYAHLQQCYTLPLPLATECVAFAASVRIECGHLLGDIIRIMQAQGAHMSALQRVTVLHCTDLPVRPAFEYAEHNDRLQHVRARRLHIVWARGLHADWQQPLFLSTGGLSELVPAIRAAIVRLHAIQYNVIACCARFGEMTTSATTEEVAPALKPGSEHSTTTTTATTTADSDRVNNNAIGGGCDAAALWQQLGVSRGYSYFSHPVTNEPVYTFYFGGDLLESVRRTLWHRGGFRTVDTPSVHIGRAPLDAVRAVAPGWYAAAESDVRQLFTARTSELLRAVRPAQYAICADFVDVFGAYATMMFEAEYGGERLEAQMQTLSHVQLQLYKLRGMDTVAAVTDGDGGAGVPVFKAAMAHTIESLKLLQHTMRQKYGVDAFPARAVSEDCLRQRWWASGADTSARSLRDTLDRLRRMAVHVASGGDAMAAAAAAPQAEVLRIDVTRPERHYVQRLIDGMVQPYATLAERQKFVADLWRMEERFQALWRPFFVGGAGAAGHDAAAAVLTVEHVLRDTLGKLKPAASLECAVRYMQQRIALRVAVVNELGGVERWPSYVLRTSAAAVAAARQSVD